MTAQYAADLAAVHRRANRLPGWRAKGLRRRYERASRRPVLGASLRRAEVKAWKVAQRCGRAGAAAGLLRQLAGVSNAARNAGLAVLVRDLIPNSLFARLTRVWRAAWLPLPKAPKRKVTKR